MVRPPAVGGVGREAVDLAAAAGLVLDPEQELVVETIFAERADGKWAASEVGICIPRQNGKGAILEATELCALFLLREQQVLHSSHEFKTTIEHFLRMRALIDRCSDLSRMVTKIVTSHGDEAIHLSTGGRLRFVARTGGSGRGFSAQRIILDEAMKLPASVMGALIPTLSAQQNPQIIYAGSAGDSLAEHWWSIRKRAQAVGDGGVAGRLAWFEWGCPDGVNPADRSAWAAANPAFPHRVGVDSIEMEFAAMPAGEFLRERLGVWDQLASDAGAAVISSEAWAACVAPASQPGKRLVWAWALAPQRAAGAIVVVSESTLGGSHVEVVEHRPGAGWVAGRLAELVARHGGSGAVCPPGESASIVGDVTAALKRVTVKAATATEMAAACSMFVGAVDERTLRVIPSPTLVAQALGAGVKPAGDGWRWRVGEDGDISALSAATVGVWALSVSWTKSRDPLAMVH